MSFDDQRVWYYLVLALLVVVMVAVAGLRRSRTARALIASRDNEQAAQSFGISLVRLRLSAFAISGFIAAFAGALFAYHAHGVRVQAYSPEQSVLMFLIAVIGGLGSIWGPVIGGAYFTPLILFSATPLVNALASGGGGLFILYMLPGGLSQLVFGIRDAILRRVAQRRRIVVPSLVADLRRTGIHARAPIIPNVRAGGGAVFVPVKYRLSDQWLLEDVSG